LPQSLLEPQDDGSLQAASIAAGATYLSLVHSLCDATGCLATTGSHWSDVITYDKAHFTQHGSILVAQRIWPQLSAAAGLPAGNP
jgi:hypothetical protein